MSRLKRLFGRTRRQRVLRAVGLGVFSIVMAMIVFWFVAGESVLEDPTTSVAAIYYWPICILLLVIWLVLVVLDMRAVLREIADRHP